jgi:hypothetical protein
MRFTKATLGVAVGLTLMAGGLATPVLASTAGAEGASGATAPPRSTVPVPAMDAAGWLGRQFLANGDLPTSEEVAGLNNVPLALVALVAAATGSKQASAGLKYLEGHFESFVSIPVSKTKSVDAPGRLADVILAAVATRANPSRFGGDGPKDNLVARLLATETLKGKDEGLFGSPDAPTYSSAYTQGLALLALAAAGQPNAAGAAWLVRQQCAGGGWTSYRADTSTSCPTENASTFAGADTNSTALAIEALVASKTSLRVSPLAFLHRSQYPNGGFGYIGAVAKSQPVDPDSTSLVIQALVALGKLSAPIFARPGGTPEQALERFQLGCSSPASERGSYGYPGESGPNLFATVQAIPAAARKPYPIEPGTLSVALPTTSCSTSGTTSRHSRPHTAGSVEKSCPSLPKPRHGQVVVPIVVDFGSATSRISVTCVAVPTGSTGSDVLAKRAAVLGTSQPVYSSSGLLCQIDGYPSSGCGTQSGSHYAYWAYFHGGKRWTYANDGPAENDVGPGDVEGWRFEPDGSASPSDPAPRTASSVSGLEATASAPTTSTTTTVISSPPSTLQGGVTTTSSSLVGGGTVGSKGTSGGQHRSGTPSSSKGGSSTGSTNGAGSSRHGSVLAAGGVTRSSATSPATSTGRYLLLALAGIVIIGGAIYALLFSRRRVGAER